MKVAWTLVTANGVQCLLTDMDKKYNPEQNPTFIQSWSPDGRDPDVDPNRTEPPIGPWEGCEREGAVLVFSGNGKRTYVLTPD